MFRFLIVLIVMLASCKSGQKVSKENGMFGSNTENEYVIFSPMKGVVTFEGKPLRNVRILRTLRWNGNDSGKADSFYTNEEGWFDIPIHAETLKLSMMEQFVAHADLQIERDGELQYIWTSNKFFPEVHAETKGPISGLVCELTSDEAAISMGPTSILTVCHWNELERQK